MKELPATDVTNFNPQLGCSEYEWGEPVDYPISYAANGIWGQWKNHQYHVEVLSWHYHDYVGNHAFVQVWDYAQQSDPDQRWQYMLLLHRPVRTYDEDGSITGGTWSWVIQAEYTDRPSNATVGADVDLWCEAPEDLRFILE